MGVCSSSHRMETWRLFKPEINRPLIQGPRIPMQTVLRPPHRRLCNGVCVCVCMCVRTKVCLPGLGDKMMILEILVTQQFPHPGFSEASESLILPNERRTLRTSSPTPLRDFSASSLSLWPPSHPHPPLVTASPVLPLCIC